MPYLSESTYRPPRFLSNGHVQTLYAALWRSVADVRYSRLRVETPDHDFLDLDWSRASPNKVAILCHGLEGSSHKPYMLGMARALNRCGISTVSMNYRGCSGEINAHLRSYHCGSTDDVQLVFEQVARDRRVEEIYLIGFSLGGNLALKYVGEQGSSVDRRLKSCVAFSVPTNLASCVNNLTLKQNRLYFLSFVRSIQAKLEEKNRKWPGSVRPEVLGRVYSFKELDEYHTAPVHGFQSAEEYWDKSSCGKYLANIGLPTLLVNAADDPLLSLSCYPEELAVDHPYFFFEKPRHGGHVGFVSFEQDGNYWSERRALNFILNRSPA